MPHDDPIHEAAVAWAVRTGDAAFDDWENFTVWLEENPAHAAAYDRVTAALADAVEAVEAVEPQVSVTGHDENSVGPTVNRRWFGAALAACLSVMLAIGMWQFGDDARVYETLPGEMQSIALADGSTIHLSGGTKLIMNPDDARFARLEHGQALFDILHDDTQPFRLEVGEDTLVDMGTIFDVRAGISEMSVSVSEGVVVFNPSLQNVRMDPGDHLTSAAGSDEYLVRQVPLAQVGEWREGRITFRHAMLPEVVDDLSKKTGVTYRVASDSRMQPISGSLLLTPLQNDPASLGPLLGLSVSKSGDEWVVEAR